MIDVFTKVVLAGACLFTFAWVILAQRRTIRRLSDAYLRLTHFQRVVVVLTVIVCTVYAQKPSTNDVERVSGTNDVEIVEGGDTNGVGEATSPSLLMTGTRPFTSGETPHPHFSAPCRLESVSTNEGYSYAMPADGTLRGTWHLTGAYEDVQKVTLDGFAFPLGSDLCASLWAYTWGKVRPQLKNASNEIAAVGAPMSAIPDASRFWTAATSNDTYLLTWENFAAGRINGEAVSSPLQDGIAPPQTSGQESASPFLSAQIELFRNGDFITRSNDVECVYRRVIEPNPIVDPINPPDPDDPSRPLYPYGSVQDLSVVEEPDAYCWVDIVVDNADAWVRFEGDGASNLADPSFAAKAGETNHVVILIGKTYKVTCDMPFTVVGKSDPAIDEWWEGGNTLWLNWPVSIWSVGDDEEPPLLLMSFGNGSPRRRGFTMFVSPAGLGGGFTWTNCCCSVSGSGYYFSYNCNADCSCGGCAATGYFSYEGYRLSASGGSCGCGSPEEPHDPHEGDPDEPPVPVGVSASFSKRVIFLENEYANTTNEVVPWYSDASSLCCSAWGGENGGHVSISIVGDSNLIQYGGQPFPIERDLEPYEVFAFTNTYKAVSESSGYEAIVVTATFDENDSDWSETSIAKATAVRVEVEPHVGREGCPNRHVLGVREQIGVKTHPADVATIELSDVWLYEQEDGDTGYRCPASAMQGGLTVKVDGCNYEPNLDVIEPVGIVCHRGWVRRFGAARGSAGGIGMSLDLTITPESVSFTGLVFVEVPSEDGSRNGYFTNSIFASSQSHTEDNEAGTWYKISPDNHFFDDCPRMERTCPQPWYDGEIIWEIPIAWGRRESRNLVDGLGNMNGYQQTFTIDSFGGVCIDKFENWVKRMPNDDVTHSPGIIEVQ